MIRPLCENDFLKVQTITNIDLTKEEYCDYLNLYVGLCNVHNHCIHSCIFYEVDPYSVPIIEILYETPCYCIELLNKLKTKLKGRRTSIFIEINEYRLELQLLLKSQGFKAVTIYPSSFKMVYDDN